MTTVTPPFLVPLATSPWRTWNILLVARYKLYLMPINIFEVLLQSNKFHSKTEVIVRLLNELMPSSPPPHLNSHSSDSITGECLNI